ncbi:hypothetical protein DD563_04705 [Pelagicola sp. LXJ1103]|nr:hypothetical protein DD563_04705 [Pelagicola sp. LXJ1103]
MKAWLTEAHPHIQSPKSQPQISKARDMAAQYYLMNTVQTVAYRRFFAAERICAMIWPRDWSKRLPQTDHLR